MSGHTLNLIPDDWTPNEKPGALRSAVVCALLTVVLIGFGVIFAGDAHEAHGSTSLLPGPGRKPPDRCRLPSGDPAMLALTRASSHYPWNEFLTQLAELIGEGARLESLRYRAVSRQLTLIGDVVDVALLPELMFALESYDWLRDPDPYQVEKDPVTGHTRFSIRIHVLPRVTIESVP